MGLGKVYINSITRELGRNVGKGVSNDIDITRKAFL